MSVVAGMLAVVVMAVDVSCAQPRPTPPEKLRSPAIVSGLIGGESHHAYVIHATKGKTMTVQLEWRNEDANRAEFTVSDMPGFFEAVPVTFGKESDNRRRWTGKIPKTANYYVYIVAHPTARYNLRVSLK